MDFVKMYNSQVIETNDWEELCEDMYDFIFATDKTERERIELEKRFLTLKGHYYKESK